MPSNQVLLRDELERDTRASVGGNGKMKKGKFSPVVSAGGAHFLNCIMIPLLLCLVTSSRSTAPLGTHMSIIAGFNKEEQESVGVYTSQLQGESVLYAFSFGWFYECKS